NMEQQHQVIIAIGSNQGNRFENIEKCIEMLHHEVGTVIRVSRLYESDAWGFDGEPFYNCALLLHTKSSAFELLDQILQIEKQLGRVRGESLNYESRVIDIDIIAFNEDVITADKLKVPHPFMQDRQFVLLPMRDLELDWRHPVLQKYLPVLVLWADDKIQCKVVDGLQSPLHKIKLDSYNYIAIEGNIGAGKTTLATRIASDFNAKTVLERFADNPFLPKFYEDQHRYAFPLEMSFLADRYQQIADDLAQFDLFKDFIRSE